MELYILEGKHYDNKPTYLTRCYGIDYSGLDICDLFDFFKRATSDDVRNLLIFTDIETIKRNPEYKENITRIIRLKDVK